MGGCGLAHLGSENTGFLWGEEARSFSGLGEHGRLQNLRGAGCFFLGVVFFCVALFPRSAEHHGEGCKSLDTQVHLGLEFYQGLRPARTAGQALSSPRSGFCLRIQVRREDSPVSYSYMQYGRETSKRDLSFSCKLLR